MGGLQRTTLPPASLGRKKCLLPSIERTPAGHGKERVIGACCLPACLPLGEAKVSFLRAALEAGIFGSHPQGKSLQSKPCGLHADGGVTLGYDFGLNLPRPHLLLGVWCYMDPGRQLSLAVEHNWTCFRVSLPRIVS